MCARSVVRDGRGTTEASGVKICVWLFRFVGVYISHIQCEALFCVCVAHSNSRRFFPKKKKRKKKKPKNRTELTNN